MENRSMAIERIIKTIEPVVTTGIIDGFSDIRALPIEVKRSYDYLRGIAKPVKRFLRPPKVTFMAIAIDWSSEEDRSNFITFSPYSIYAQLYSSNAIPLFTSSDTGTSVSLILSDSQKHEIGKQLPEGVFLD